MYIYWRNEAMPLIMEIKSIPFSQCLIDKSKNTIIEMKLKQKFEYIAR